MPTTLEPGVLCADTLPSEEETRGATPETLVLERLAARIGEDACERYFQGQTALSVKDDRIRVGVRSGFVAELLTRRFGEPLRLAAVEALAGPGRDDVHVSIEVDRPAPAPTQGARRPSTRTETVRAPRRPSKSPATRRLRLEDFVVGKANQLAYAATLRLTEETCPGNFARLVVHGGCGLGKTHLLQGLARRFEETFPGATVRYITAEMFTNEFIQAVRADRVEAFRRSYRVVDLLCVDDVHFLSSKQATQEELLHTFDALDLAGARVAMASDEHPKQIRRLNRALVSRCMSGMIVKLDPPDRELAVHLAIAIARRRGIRLNEEAARLVAETLCRSTRARPASVREIEGLITRVEAVARLVAGQGTNEMIGVAMVRRALGMDADAVTSARRRSVSVQLIASEVCAELGVDQTELHGSGRHRRVVLARSLTAFLARELTNKSFPEIARAMGRPSHSTVVTAAKRIKDQIDEGARISLADQPGMESIESGIADLAEKLTHAIAQAAAQT